jgi:hypothetical protein
MSEIQRLLRVAARRNQAGEYGSIRVRLLKTQIESLKQRLLEDGVSANVLFEAVLRGYTDRHPAVLAMLDQWQRDEQPEKKKAEKSLSSKDVADIYAELGGGILEET